VKFKRTSSGIEYRGKSFPGFNKPIKSDNPSKKKMVLAKEGDKVKLLHFGDASMGHNYSAAARRSYLARSAGIKGKDSKLSPNYWSRKVLWAGPSGSKKAPPASQKIKKYD
jgi:hypothetical protein